MTESNENALGDLLDDSGHACFQCKLDSSVDAFGVQFSPNGNGPRRGGNLYVRIGGEQSAGELGGLGEGPYGAQDLGSLEGLFDDRIATCGDGLGFVEGLEKASCHDDADGLVAWIRFDPMADLKTGSRGKEDIDDDDVGHESIEGRIDFPTVGGDFYVKAFFAEDSSTDALGVRAIVGQKNAGAQFFFFFGSLTFFAFLAGARVPLETIGALGSEAAGAAAGSAGFSAAGVVAPGCC